MKNGPPGRIRTCGLALRRGALYPAELRVAIVKRGNTIVYTLICLGMNVNIFDFTTLDVHSGIQVSNSNVLYLKKCLK